MRLAGIAVLVVGAILLIATHDSGSVLGLGSYDFARIVYLGALVLVIGSGIVATRGGLAANIRSAALWLGVFLALMLAYQSRYELQDLAHRASGGLIAASPLTLAGQPGRATVLLERGLDGHFQTDAEVDGAGVRFLVDTGASGTVLTAPDARRAGVDVDRLAFNVPVATANGTAYAARARVAEMRIGPIVRRNQTVLVVPGPALGQSLLGMSFISTLSGFDMRGDRLILRE